MATHYTDSSGEEYVPNSQNDDQEQSATDEAPGLVSSSEDTPVEADGEKDQIETHFDDNTTDEEPDLRQQTFAAHKRRKHHGNKPRKKRRTKQKRRLYARNYSRSEKLKCCDIEEIRLFVRSPPCCCKHNCLNKFKENQARATRALSNLRNARFASTSTFSMSVRVEPRVQFTPGCRILASTGMIMG